jgi:hypothetical protein
LRSIVHAGEIGHPNFSCCAAEHYHHGVIGLERIFLAFKITQTGWLDYWAALSAGFVSGTAPDVFWDHLSRYPEFAVNNLLVDLAPLIARDGVPTENYVGGLVKVWGRGAKTIRSSQRLGYGWDCLQQSYAWQG